MDRSQVYRETALERRRRRRARVRERQVRRIKRRLAVGCLTGLFMITAVIFGWKTLSDRGVKETYDSLDSYEETQRPEETSYSGGQPSTGRTEYLRELTLLAEGDERYRRILNRQSEYPEKVLRLAVQNEEALNFVLDYPEKKDSAPAESIGELREGEVPLLLQWDRRWGYAPYGESSIVAVSGCGPACIAMAACYLTGRTDITPAAVASYSAENGFLTAENDTTWSLMTYGCEAYGITGEELGLDEEAMRRQLDQNHPLIASVGPGDFTRAGHFIVITGYNESGFTVNDPNSERRSRRNWSFSVLAGQIRNLWYYRLSD